MSRYHTRLHARRWAAVRSTVFRRDGWRCVQCGKAGRLECDHVTALQREQGQDPYDLERLTGALLDRITHHVHILEMNGESYRLKQSRSRRRQPSE